MDLGTILAIVAFVLMVGFVVFAFRQGLKVKSPRYNRYDPDRWNRAAGGGGGPDVGGPGNNT
jgi:hypothetical protein